MIADRHEIAAVVRGGCDELRVLAGAMPSVGSVQKLQPGVGRPARYQARILDAWPHRDGGYVARVEIVAQEIPSRFISKRGTHFTTEPGLAARAEDGTLEWSPPEDWVDPGLEARETFRRQQAGDTIRRLMPEIDNWPDLVRFRQLARAAGIDISGDERAIELRIENMARKLRRDEAA